LESHGLGFGLLFSCLPCQLFLLSYAASLLRSTLVSKVSIPITQGLDVIAMLTDDATVAAWNNEGLPSDRMSTENATILTHCERWPLMIDPQQQGIKWIKNKYGTDLKVTHLGQKGYVNSEGIGIVFSCYKVGPIFTVLVFVELFTTLNCYNVVYLPAHISYKGIYVRQHPVT
jgi:hypothetical protein